MSPVDSATTISTGFSLEDATPRVSKITNFFNPIASTVLPLGNFASTPTTTAEEAPQPCDTIPPVLESVRTEARLTTFAINVPPPPPIPKRLVMRAVEVPTKQVDPEEEFFINPDEFEVQKVSRITAPAGSVVYKVAWSDGHTAEIPVSSIYNYVSEDDLERLEHNYFKHNENPETIYDDDPDYPGGAPTGGTLAFQRGYLLGPKESRPRLLPEERRLRMQMRLGERAFKRPRGRPGRPRTKSPGRKPQRRLPGRPKKTVIENVASAANGNSVIRLGDGTPTLKSRWRPPADGNEQEEGTEMSQEEFSTYEDELSAHFAAEVNVPSREDTPISATTRPPQVSRWKHAIPASDVDDETDSGANTPANIPHDSTIAFRPKSSLLPYKGSTLETESWSTSSESKPRSYNATTFLSGAYEHHALTLKPRKLGRPRIHPPKENPRSPSPLLPKLLPGFNPEDYEDFGPEKQDYLVESILAFRRTAGQKFYLVKWEGFSEEQSTWEPVESLKGSWGLVEEFERRRLRGG